MYFKTDNSKSLLSKMIEACKIKNNLHNLKENRAFVSENYTIENYINNYLNIYRI
jgi:hypothetical protein